MNIKEFSEIITGELTFKLGSGFSIIASPVKKNNGVTLMGVTIRDNSNQVAPVIYLDKYFESYNDGDAEMDDIVTGIIDAYNTHSNLPGGLQIEDFLNWEKAKKHISCRIVNYDSNKDILEDVPYVQFLDLVIVFQYLHSEESGSASVLIHNAHMSKWNVTEETLLMVAKNNLSEDVQIVPMSCVIAKMLGKENAITDVVDTLDNMMSVMSNKTGVYGANAILCVEALSKHAHKIDDDIVILPSSIHELILLPASSCGDVNSLSEMIKEVNSTQLVPEEILSDHPYIFSRELRKVVLPDEIKH